MELKIRKNGEIYIIDVNGEMDLYNSYKLKELVMKMLEKSVKSFIINLEQVDYIDSSGIGALIYICSTIKKMNLKLAISNIHGSVKKVIELTKLMGYFPIANSVEEALLMINKEDLETKKYNVILSNKVASRILSHLEDMLNQQNIRTKTCSRENTKSTRCLYRQIRVKTKIFRKSY